MKHLLLTLCLLCGVAKAQTNAFGSVLIKGGDGKTYSVDYAIIDSSKKYINKACVVDMANHCSSFSKAACRNRLTNKPNIQKTLIIQYSSEDNNIIEVYYDFICNNDFNVPQTGSVVVTFINDFKPNTKKEHLGHRFE